MSLNRQVLKLDLNKLPGTFQQTESLLYAGWPVWEHSEDCWNTLKEQVPLTNRTNEKMQHQIRACQLLFCCGCKWSAAADFCFVQLIQSAAEQKNPSEQLTAGIDWLLRTRQTKNLFSLQQLAASTVRQQLGFPLIDRIPPLSRSLPSILANYVVDCDVLSDPVDLILSKP